MVNIIIMGGLYRHYKGNNYRVIGLVKHSETLETLVHYECLYDNPEGSHWVRPLAMFLETIELNGETVPRFKYLGDASEVEV